MKIKILVTSLLFSCLQFASAQLQELDKVAVIVDQSVVLESEIKELLRNVKSNALRNNQSLPSDLVLRTQAIERLRV